MYLFIYWPRFPKNFLSSTVSPKDVKVQIQTLTVVEGGTALLVCSCKADPPASEYRWSYSESNWTVPLHQRTHMVRLYNVTRGMRVRCSARNLIGRGESKPTSLNIQCNVFACKPTYSSHVLLIFTLAVFLFYEGGNTRATERESVSFLIQINQPSCGSPLSVL